MKEQKINKNLKIYRRADKNTAYYYAAIKSSTQKNKYYRLSTNETNARKATAVAKRMELDIHRKETVGAIVNEKTFSFIAKQYAIHVQHRIEKGFAKKIEAEYVRCVEDKFVPFFGNYLFTALNQHHVEEYASQRKKQISRTRQQTEQAAWNALQKFAVNNNYSNKQIDFIKVAVSEAKQRLDFTRQQQQTIRRALEKKKSTISKRAKTNELSELLRDYYYLLLHSAIRVGYEFMRVRYTSFEYKSVSELDKSQQQFFAEVGMSEYLVCHLRSGETKTSKSRTVIIRTNSQAFENALLSIASRTQHSADIYEKHLSKNKLKTYPQKVACLKELFATCDEYVLRLRSDENVNDLSDAEQQKRMTRLSENTSKAFNQLLKENDLYEDAVGNKRSLYSIRHTYATELLEQTSNLVLVAEQIGNSTLVLDKFYNKARATTKADAFVGVAEQIAYDAKSTKSETKSAIERMRALLKEMEGDL